LLKVNIKFLDRCFLLTSEEQLLALKDSFNLIFAHCLDAMKDHNLIRCVHGFEVCCISLSLCICVFVYVCMCVCINL
jgi:hypothetical protein